MLINAETNAALNLQEETVFYPKTQSMDAMDLLEDDINKYLGVLAIRVIKHESFGNVTPAYITYFKSCSVICTHSMAFIMYLNHKYFI